MHIDNRITPAKVCGKGKQNGYNTKKVELTNRKKLQNFNLIWTVFEVL